MTGSDIFEVPAPVTQMCAGLHWADERRHSQELFKVVPKLKDNITFLPGRTVAYKPGKPQIMAHGTSVHFFFGDKI